MVCGLTLSSAATTRTAMSVTSAPRALIAVKASCPGVSRNTIFFPFMTTSEAPMCCVIPPDSEEVTLVLRIASKRDVLPWSTCPITVIIGGLGTKSASVSGLMSIPTSALCSSTSTSPMITLMPMLSARVSTVV